MENSGVQFPTIFTVVNPLKIFWNQALQAILLCVGIGLLAMALLLFIPRQSKVDILKIPKNHTVKTLFGLFPKFSAKEKPINILQFSNINYWRGNWAADNLFAFMPNCKSDVKMLFLTEDNYTERVIKHRKDITFFNRPCTTLAFGFSNFDVITWQMDYYRISTFWTERTIFGAYSPLNPINKKKFNSRIAYPNVCLEANCFVTAVPKKRNNFRILIQDKKGRQIIISDKRKFLFCGVQDTNTENYITFGNGYNKHLATFLSDKNICLYACFDMCDGQFSYEHPFIHYGRANGAILMKPNARYISKLSLHLVKIDEESLHLEGLTNRKTEIQLPEEIDPRSYFVGCQWFEDWATVVITSRNFQTTWYLSCTYKKPGGKCKILWIKDWTLSKGYSDILSAGFNDGEKLLTVTPTDSGNKTSRLKLFDTKNMNIYLLTRDNLFVIELVRWEKVNQAAYYIASEIVKPGERHLYKSTFVNETYFQVDCLTCSKKQLSAMEKTTWPTCYYSSVKFSPKGSYYLLDCLGGRDGLKTAPQTLIVSTRSNKIIYRLDNRETELGNYKEVFHKIPAFKFFECPINGGKYHARIKLQLPPEFTPSKKYSLLMGVDSRIGSQQVNRKWNVDVGTFASVKKNYIYAVADVRGSGYQGYVFESELYKNIGDPEVEDLLVVLKWLLRKFPYIDSKNVFVQGEQYGGMIAVMMAIKEPNLIKAVAAYHPPLFWTGTSAFFAERLLGLPTLEDNHYGYEAKSIGENVNRYRSMKILIVMDTSTNSGGHSQQILKLRDKINNESYPFEFLNVIELCYGSVIERARHKMAYYQMMFQYLDKFNKKN